MKKNGLVLFIVLNCLTLFARGQSLDLQSTVENAFVKSAALHPRGVKMFIVPGTELKRSMLFSVMISTSKSGHIDSIRFTKGAYMIDSVVTLSKVRKYLTTKAAATVAHYKNAIIIAPVWIRDTKGPIIHITSDFLTSYDDLIPQYLSKIKNPKAVFVLQTIRLNVGSLQY